MGANAEVFRVHRKLALQESEMFNAAFSNDMYQEGAESCMSLPTVDLHIFRMFTHWLYSRRCPFCSVLNPNRKDKNLFAALCKLYLFAEQYMIPTLKNHLLRPLFRCAKKRIPRHEEVWYMYENTPPNSAVRKMLSECMGFYLPLNWFAGEGKELLRPCQDLAVDVMAVLARRQLGEQWQLDAQHEDMCIKNFVDYEKGV